MDFIKIRIGYKETKETGENGTANERTNDKVGNGRVEMDRGEERTGAESKEKVAEEKKREKRRMGEGKAERSQGNRCVSPGQIRLGDVIKIGKMCLMNIHLCLDLLILNWLGSVRFEYCHPPLCRRHAAD